MPVGDYCRKNPHTASPGESLRDAAKRMDATDVGCLVVTDDSARPIGMITDRDVALAVLRRQFGAEDTRVADVMNHPVVTVTENAAIGVVMILLRRDGLRRLAVVDNEGKLTGIIAADDLLQLVSSELSAAAATVRSQFPADLRGDHALPAGGA